MKSGKKVKKESHSSNTPYGQGDSYGSGVKNPVGKMRDTYMEDQKPAPKRKRDHPVQVV